MSGPNLIISYAGNPAAKRMVTRIVSSGQVDTYNIGESISFFLPPGKQEIIIQTFRNYRRYVYVNSSGDPVRIKVHVGLNTKIEIEQPEYINEDVTGFGKYSSLGTNNIAANRCEKCGEELVSHAKFCPRCGFERKNNNDKCKCVYCGAILSRLDGFCPNCGHEVTNKEVADSLSEFATRIDLCDKEIANDIRTVDNVFTCWSPGKKVWWIIFNTVFLCFPWFLYSAITLGKMSHTQITLLPVEKKKEQLISNFPFPNTRESIVEAMLFIQEKVRLISINSIVPRSVYWLKCWENKCYQIKTKSQIVLGDDKTVENIDSVIRETVKNSRLKGLKKARVSFFLALIFFILRIAMIAVPIVISNYQETSLYHQRMERIESIDSKNLSRDDIVLDGWLSRCIDIDNGKMWYDSSNLHIVLSVSCKASAQEVIDKAVKDKMESAKISEADNIYEDGVDIKFNGYSEYIGWFNWSSNFYRMYNTMTSLNEGETTEIKIDIPVTETNIDSIIKIYDYDTIGISINTTYRIYKDDSSVTVEIR